MVSHPTEIKLNIKDKCKITFKQSIYMFWTHLHCRHLSSCKIVTSYEINKLLSFVTFFIFSFIYLYKSTSVKVSIDNIEYQISLSYEIYKVISYLINDMSCFYILVCNSILLL